MSKLRVLIVDDHTLFRKGLKEILYDMPIIGSCEEAKSGLEALELIKNNFFDLVFLDIAMPDMDGLEVLKRIKAIKPELKVLILSMYSEEQYASRAIKAGADGFMNKSADPEELAKAIEKISRGSKYLPESFTERIVDLFQRPSQILPHERLSEREFQVFKMIAQGKSLVEISKELSISIKTVSTYRARVLEKLNLKNNAEIVNYAIRNSLISD